MEGEARARARAGLHPSLSGCAGQSTNREIIKHSANRNTLPLPKPHRKDSKTATMASPLDSRRPTSSSSPSQDPELSPLEQQVLDEYATLVGNLDNVRFLVPHPPSQSALTGYSAAVRNSWRTRGEPLSRDPGLAARAGAQDGDGLHAAEGERVLHRAAAGDSGRGRGVAWALKGIFVNLCFFFFLSHFAVGGVR